MSMSSNEPRPAKRAGGCHCGDVRYEAMVDTSTASGCNCTICTKLGVLVAVVKPDAFKLLSDEAKLASYSRAPEIANRFFCAQCHVHCFGKGHLAEVGGDYVAINLNTLDDFDPARASIVYWDGRHDNWGAGTRSAPWPIQS
jgi:hypothetical protein